MSFSGSKDANYYCLHLTTTSLLCDCVNKFAIMKLVTGGDTSYNEESDSRFYDSLYVDLGS